MRYPGGKRKLSRRLYLRRPPHSEFRELFMGGGSMLRHVSKSSMNWFNEKNPMVFDHWWQMKTNPDYLDELLGLIKQANYVCNPKKLELFMSHRGHIERLREWLDDIGWQRNSIPSLDEYLHAKRKAGYSPVSWYLVTNWAKRSVCCLNRKNIASYDSAFLYTGKLSQNRNRFLREADVLRNAKLTCHDYSVPLLAPGKSVWLFLDPPYICGDSQMYDESWGESKHEQLATQLRESPHNWLLTIGDRPLFRELYHGYSMEYVGYTVTLPHKRHSKAQKKGKGGELWIRNYLSRSEKMYAKTRVGWMRKTV